MELEDDHPVNLYYPNTEKIIVGEDEETYHVEARYRGCKFRYIQHKDGSPPFPFDIESFTDIYRRNRKMNSKIDE